MKKSLLALAAFAACALSANADFYAIGGAEGWGQQNPNYKFTKTSTTGVYELKYKGNFISGFKINDGSWDNPDYNFGSNGSDLVIGEPYYYGIGLDSKDINIKGGAVANPTLILNVNEGTLTIKGETADIEYGYGIHGTIFTGSDWTTTLMDEMNGKWVLTATIVPGEFGIKVVDKSSGNQTTDPSGSNWYSAPNGNNTVAVDKAMPYVTSGGVDWSSSLEGKYIFTLDLDAKTLTLTEDSSSWNDIAADENATFAIYSIEGNLVKASANMNDVENLESGMYIINGAKVMICK